MATETTQPAQGGQGAGTPASESLTEERVTEIVKATLGETLNPAIVNHFKRFSRDMEKTVADIVGKAVATLAPKPEETQAEDPKSKVDPQVAKLQEKLDKLERANLEAEKRAKDVEDKSRRDSMRTSVREALETKGIKGLRAQAVIALLEQSGTLRLNDEGEPMLVVKRVRGAKGSAAQEVDYNDLSEGIDDWSKTSEAQEFLPPPAPPAPKYNGRPTIQPGYMPTGKPGEAPRLPRTIDEVCESIETDIKNDPNARIGVFGR